MIPPLSVSISKATVIVLLAMGLFISAVPSSAVAERGEDHRDKKGDEEVHQAEEEVIPQIADEDAWIEDLLNDTEITQGPSHITKGRGITGTLPENVNSYSGPTGKDFECRAPLFYKCLDVREETRKENAGTVWNQAFYGYDSTGHLSQLDAVVGAWGSYRWLIQGEYEIDANGKQCSCFRTANGCLAADVAIRMSNGAEKKIQDIQVGDLVHNPITGKAMKVKQLVQGPEPLPLLQISFGEKSIQVSQQHPMLVIPSSVKAGLQQTSLTNAKPTAQERLRLASEVAVGDSVIGSDGSRELITAIEPQPVSFSQQVYNLIFDVESEKLRDHMIVSNGIITGDFDAQTRLSARAAK